MKKTFFARWALPLLMAIFFLAPFALRGARLAIDRMQNDVQEWLPSDFSETRDLRWFQEHFPSDQFILISWEGCTGRADDERFKTLIGKLIPERPPSQRQEEGGRSIGDGPSEPGAPQPDPRPGAVAPGEGRIEAFIDPGLDRYVREYEQDPQEAANFVGNRLGLTAAPATFDNWGGLQEKWLLGEHEQWYYLTPDGNLYRWNVSPSWIARLIDTVRRRTSESYRLAGERVASFGAQDGRWYYEHPRRLAMRPYSHITTGPGTLHELTRPGGPLEGQADEAMERLKGTLFGPDGEQTCIVLSLNETGKRNIRRILGRGILGKPRGTLLALASESGIHPPASPTLAPPPLSWLAASEPVRSPVLRMGGPPVDNVAIDEEGQVTLVRLVGLSIAVGLLLTWYSFRSVHITLMVFFCGGLSAVASVSFVYWTGSVLGAVLMSMPSLIYVLGLSGAVHLVNYYRESVEESGLAGAPETALRRGWKPCFLAAFTTALGLLSLLASNIIPIRKFGMYSALGVMATLLLLFTFIPSALQLWPPRAARRRQVKNRFDDFLTGFWGWVADMVIRHNGKVALGCTLLMLLFAIGIPRINTSVELLKLFDQDAKIIRDYRWLEENLGMLVPMEVVVRVAPEMIADQRDLDLGEAEDGRPAAGMEGAGSTTAQQEAFPLTFLERMELTAWISERLYQEFGQPGQGIMGRPMSASTFAPPLPPPGAGFRRAALRGAYSKSLRENRDRFIQTGYLQTSREGDELWRISLRLAALKNVDFGYFVGRLEGMVEPALGAVQARSAILRQVQQNRPGGSIRGGRVVLAGAELGPFPLSGRGDSGGSQPARSADQHQAQIFATILWRLLQNVGIDVVGWHDPRFPLPGNWSSLVDQSDVVVLLGTDRQFAQHATNTPVVDVRNNVFRPHDGERLTADQQEWPISAVYTGVVPVVYKAQRTLLTSLIESTDWAFVMIAGVMALLLRSLRAGLISMLPNVFPLFLVFGAMGWSRVLVDIGSMMTASVALGVAVDDTIHLLTWFRRGLDAGMQRHEAIRWAYIRVAPAMTQSSIIAGFGLSIFAFSTFTPTQRFGVLMLTLVLAALVGDLIYLPSLLAGPLGAIFRPKGSAAGEPPDGAEAPGTPLHGPHWEHAGPVQADRAAAQRNRSGP